MTSNNSILTCDTSEQLAGEALYLTAWEWHEAVAFEKIEDALSE